MNMFYSKYCEGCNTYKRESEFKTIEKERALCRECSEHVEKERLEELKAITPNPNEKSTSVTNEMEFIRGLRMIASKLKYIIKIEKASPNPDRKSGYILVKWKKG